MKFRFLTAILFSALPAFFFISCSKTSADRQTMNPPPPGNGTSSCDTADMKYAADVVPILQSHCYACHGSNSNTGSGGIILDSYNDLKTYAGNGYLKGNITHATGYIGMPYGQPKMDDCTINKIVDWISQGAQNN